LIVVRKKREKEKVDGDVVDFFVVVRIEIQDESHCDVVSINSS